MNHEYIRVINYCQEYFLCLFQFQKPAFPDPQDTGFQGPILVVNGVAFMSYSLFLDQAARLIFGNRHVRKY